jgi:hypothetical protein
MPLLWYARLKRQLGRSLLRDQDFTGCPAHGSGCLLAENGHGHFGWKCHLKSSLGSTVVQYCTVLSRVTVIHSNGCLRRPTAHSTAHIPVVSFLHLGQPKHSKVHVCLRMAHSSIDESSMLIAHGGNLLESSVSDSQTLRLSDRVPI